MNTGVTTATSVAAVKSVLEKPLHELTEDDIAQLTREDCRRYLKEKGMRRPSWNKSQAIQQVISLKSLLEPTPPKPAPQVPDNSPRLPTNNSTVPSNSSSSVKDLSSTGGPDRSGSALGENGGPNPPADPSGSDAVKEGECHLPGAAIDSETIRVRSSDALRLPLGQMTIFYSGKVNVYDGVPVDKQARAIMHLAANPIQFCQDELSYGNSMRWSTPSPFPPSNVKVNMATQDATTVKSVITGKIVEPIQHRRSEGSILHEPDIEGQTNRQVCLQRYFEKRKDRGKFKMKRKIGASSSGLEMYLSHQMKTPVINRQTTQSNSSCPCPTQLGIPCVDYASTDKQLKNHGLSVDLNDKA